MDKRILYGGAAALGAYFWWASRSSSTPATTVTRTPSTTPNGVGFAIGDLLGLTAKPYQLTPDAKAVNPVVTSAPAGPAPATTDVFSTGIGGPGNGGPNATPAANSRRILDDILGNARAADQYITNPVAATGNQHGGPAYTWNVISDAGQVAKYDAIKDFVGQAYDGSAASLAAIAAKAQETGTSSADAAIALGMTPQDLQGWYDRAGVKAW